MQRLTSSVRLVPPGIMALSLMMVYLMTMAPGITWANQGSDGGDLIAAAAGGGVAHPTGYPVYLLLARGFQLLPIGSLAFRTNLMSAFAAVFASLLVYHLAACSRPSPEAGRNILAGLVSAYAFGLSPLLWSQAVITEVQSLHAMFVALLLYLVRDRSPGFVSRRRLNCALGLTFGLAMGNHISIILLSPLLLISIPFTKPAGARKNAPMLTDLLDFPSLGCRFAGLAVGLSAYLILPLRALSHPPVNWGSPDNPGGFWWLVSGKLYQDHYFGSTSSALWERAQSVAALLLEQFGIPGLIFGLMGLVVFYKHSRLYKTTIWTVFVFSIFAVGYGSHDSFLYLIPVHLCYAIWLGLGFAGMINPVAQRFSGMGKVIGLFVILYLFILAGYHWPKVDASDDLRAEQFGQDVLAQAPPQAILFAKTDRAVFTMWYFHFALNNRPDLVVVATDLLSYKWYQDTLRNTYPDLIMPAHAPFPQVVIESNPGRSVCFLYDDRAVQIKCRE